MTTDKVRGARYGLGCGVVFGKTDCRQRAHGRDGQPGTLKTFCWAVIILAVLYFGPTCLQIILR